MQSTLKGSSDDSPRTQFSYGAETSHVNLSNRHPNRTNYSQSDGHQPTDTNELFADEQIEEPWWKSQFFISQPVLFGMWDGVFTSCLINIFGVIVFLRSGWVVAQAGILNAILIILSSVGVVLISVLSAVGICERCRVESGGVYFLLAYVLGSRFAGAIGLLYTFGQAVGCALSMLGLGESIAGLLEIEKNPWAQRVFASLAVMVLSVIDLAGIKWVVKLQFVLLLVLLFAGLDFAVGSFVHTDVRSGFDGWSISHIKENLWSEYFDNYSWFTVFGVFFPTITGIMAGINMSGDLRHPSEDIPNGTFAALGTGTGLYLLFALVLGSTCSRIALKDDYLMSAKVSAVRVLLLAGLYVSSMSSCLGAIYGTARVLQSIANENLIPFSNVLSRGKGPNRLPVSAMALTTGVIVIFTLFGDINSLAPIVTMPFLLMYASVDYAYFALAMTYDLQSKREQKLRSTANNQNVGNASSGQNCDLDSLFPERYQLPNSSIMTPTSASDQQNSLTVIVHSKTSNWYSSWCNRWLSLFGALLKIFLMCLVNWSFAVMNLAVCIVIWAYVGFANPAVKPGVANQFNVLWWLRWTCLKLFSNKEMDYEEIVVTPNHPDLELFSEHLNEDNEDFAHRQRFHQTATVMHENLQPNFIR
ncbi:unnamed protein product [Bemisia tabaci]|uniref:Solute carrier family 12 member 8 n=1 Tax=Bemisia tabaci TaxID=7038 RepID=A0A9P0AET5_BEMTA|nr:unnamed protein product [Bemisia tabaci]